MLSRVGGRNWLRRDEDFRRELYEAVRALALERFGEDVDERLPFNLRLRSKLLRRGDYDALGRLSRSSGGSRRWVRVRGIERGGTHLVLRLESWSGDPAPGCASSAGASGPSGCRRPTASPRRSRARTAR